MECPLCGDHQTQNFWSKPTLDINGITVQFAERLLPVPLILFTIAPQIEPGKISTVLKAHPARL